jgi:hypothetical protein
VLGGVPEAMRVCVSVDLGKKTISRAPRGRTFRNLGKKLVNAATMSALKDSTCALAFAVSSSTSSSATLKKSWKIGFLFSKSIGTFCPLYFW